MSDHAMSLREADVILTAPGQMFETERAVVEGIEMTVWKNAPSNLRQMLDASLQHGDKEFWSTRNSATPFASTTPSWPPSLTASKNASPREIAWRSLRATFPSGRWRFGPRRPSAPSLRR